MELAEDGTCHLPHRITATQLSGAVNTLSELLRTSKMQFSLTKHENVSIKQDDKLFGNATAHFPEKEIRNERRTKLRFAREFRVLAKEIAAKEIWCE